MPGDRHDWLNEKSAAAERVWKVRLTGPPGGGFSEREIARMRGPFGNIMRVFSANESRRNTNDQKPNRGSDSIRPLDDGTRSWLVRTSVVRIRLPTNASRPVRGRHNLITSKSAPTAPGVPRPAYRERTPRWRLSLGETGP